MIIYYVSTGFLVIQKTGIVPAMHMKGRTPLIWRGGSCAYYHNSKPMGRL